MIFLRALSVFLGTIIGVGIFALPFMALKAGFFVSFLYFLIMGLIVISIHLLYGKIVLGTEKVHRLPGYAGQYLNKKWKKFSFVIMAVGLGGALLAYLIIGGEFLGFLLIPFLGGSFILYTLIFFAFGAYLIFRGTKSISQVELFLFFVLLVILAVFLIKTLPSIEIDYFKTIDLKFLTFPYGVVLFSLWGLAVIPEIKEILEANLDSEKKVGSSLKKVIFWGIIISAFIYLLFIFIVLGVSGPDTSKEAISGLQKIMGGNIVKLGFIFGIIACFTSFLTLGLTLKKTLCYDFGFSENFSWILACFPPLIFFLLGLREFIEVIGFTGAVALGFEGLIVVFLYRGFLKKKFSIKMNPVFYLLAVVFILGIVLEAFYFFLAK